MIGTCIDQLPRQLGLTETFRGTTDAQLSREGKRGNELGHIDVRWACAQAQMKNDDKSLLRCKQGNVILFSVTISFTDITYDRC